MEKKRDQIGGRGGRHPSNTHPYHITSAVDNEKECIVREQDTLMPIANVVRLMRSMMPSHAKISDDSKESIQECVSEFISFVTSEANMRCQHDHRRTITAEDVLWAMNNLGFDDYIEPLTIFLTRMREVENGEYDLLRGDPMVRRSIEHRPMGIAAAAFTMEGFPKDAQDAGSTSSSRVKKP